MLQIQNIKLTTLRKTGNFGIGTQLVRLQGRHGTCVEGNTRNSCSLVCLAGCWNKSSQVCHVPIYRKVCGGEKSSYKSMDISLIVSCISMLEKLIGSFGHSLGFHLILLSSCSKVCLQKLPPPPRPLPKKSLSSVFVPCCRTFSHSHFPAFILPDPDWSSQECPPSSPTWCLH